MNDQIYNEQDLQKALGRLPRSIEPDQDLWAGISGRLESKASPAAPAQRHWLTRALVASVAVAFVAGLLLGRQGIESTPGEQIVGYKNPANAGLMAAVYASEREYHAAFKAFSPSGLSLELLESDTLQDIESSWMAMQQAETALLAALEEYPENPFLGEKLLDLRAQQLGFMRQLHMLDQNSRRNT